MWCKRAHLDLATVSIAVLLMPQCVAGGTFYIGRGIGSCWCDGSIVSEAWNVFEVIYAPGGPRECEFARAAFRIDGVPDDPALMRRFEPRLPGIMTGDPFREGAIFDNFVPLPGDTEVGSIYIYAPPSLVPHFWSVEAPLGIEGVTSPVADFESAPGVWVPQWGRSILIGMGTPCDACGWQPEPRCPMAVESTAWTTIKVLYR